MDGYVMNATPNWAHAMKRAIGPGGKIYLDELFQQYGIKHNLEEGPEFIDWLRNVKLKDRNKWKIVLEDVSETVTVESSEATNTTPKEKQRNNENIAPMVKKKLTVDEVVNLSVRQARELLPKVTDLNLLKYSLQEANQLANKDSLCRIIKKRIRDLQMSR